jgi:hypothetical protein
MKHRQKSPAPPAAYRPQPTPKVLQLKKAGSVKPPSPPAPRVLQTKKAVAGPPVVRSGPGKTAVIQRARELRESPPADLPINRLRSEIVRLNSPQVNERGFFSSRSPKQIVDGLFAAFLGIGFGYDLGTAVTSCVLGDDGHAKPLRRGEKMRDAFGGNCIAMANAFAQILTEADILAKVVEVRKEEPGKAFVVHCPNFIDREVTGHIKKNGAIWNFHYLFTNHTAVWVNALNTYYDPMAGTTYHNLSQAIVMELVALDGKGDVYKGQYLGQEYLLTRRGPHSKPAPGHFFKFDMQLVPVGSIASPLGIFKEAEK